MKMEMMVAAPLRLLRRRVGVLRKSLSKAKLPLPPSASVGRSLSRRFRPMERMETGMYFTLGLRVLPSAAFKITSQRSLNGGVADSEIHV